MKRLIQGVKDSRTRLVVVGVSAALIAGTTGAVAAELFTGKDIKNGSLGAKELKKKLRKKINKGSTGGTAGTAGQAGTNGTNGAPGAPGADGDDGAPGSPGASGIATYENPEWGLITRNTIGSAVAELRSGPFGSFGVTGPTGKPPFGDGSLGLGVSDEGIADPPGSSTAKEEQATFGNEVDFLGDPVAGLQQVGFHVFQTGENAAYGARNLPNIKFEIDPDITRPDGPDPDGDPDPINYTTMVFVPDAVTATNQWSGYIDAVTTGDWYFTGSAGTETDCGQSDPPCDFAAAKAELGPAASIYTAAVGYGRLEAWVGAVDGFRINETVYDFEPFGVIETPAT